jgi:hypothetical protein
MLNRFDAVIGDRAEFLFSDVENIPKSVGLVAYSDGESGRFFVDVSNTNIDVNTDEITSSPPISFSINLPDTWTGRKANIRTICPDSDVLAEIIRIEKSKITIELPSVRLYACVIISSRTCQRNPAECCKLRCSTGIGIPPPTGLRLSGR